MKKIITLTVFLSVFFTAFTQVVVNVKFQNVRCDTVRLEGFAKHIASKNIKVPYSQTTVLQSDGALVPGMYNLLCDSISIGVLIFPDEKPQKISVEVKDNEIVSTNSKETNIYYDYLKQMRKYNARLDSLNRLFEEANNGGLPQYMMKVFVDSLSASARRINKEMRDYQISTAAKHKNTLVGSIIKTSTYLQDPPTEVISNQKKFRDYYIGHFFDNFAWEDPRVFNTAIADQKIKEYCNLIYQFDNPEYDTLLVADLNKARQNKKSYELLFDAFENVLGKNISPYKVEHTYIAMLKDALAHPGLDENRERRYKRELSYIDKNLAGDIIPDFNMVLANGDTTTMHAIQSDYTLLYLQHPTCPTCHQVRHRMKDFSKLNTAIKSGRLKVVMIYFEDDEQVWNNYIRSSEANPDYINGWNYDQSIDDNNLFDTRTIPYMFLLDKDKRVIKKDLLVNEIEPYIEFLKIW